MKTLAKRGKLKMNRIWINYCLWEKRGYPEGIPDEAPYELEAERLVPSYRRICKCLLRNDWWCKGLSFSQPLSEAYKKFKKIKSESKKQLETM